MIKSFKDKALEECWQNGKCKGIKASLKRRALMKLDSMDAAACLEDLANPPSNRLHRLKGEYKDYWVISVNGPWRLLFRIENNNIYDIMLKQYH